MIYTPSFNGEFIFGYPVTMNLDDDPRAKQVNGFPGIDGVEVLDLGFRLMRCNVRGRIWGNDPASVGAGLSQIRGYRNANAYPLYTTQGMTFPYAQIHTVSEVPPLRADLGSQQFYMDYTCIIWIL